MIGRLLTGMLVGVVASILLVAPLSNAQSICQPDRLDIRHQPQMIQAARGLDIDIETIRFQTCNSPSFNTAMVGSAVTVNYPTAMPFGKIVGALTHELGHVYQLRRAGSTANLLGELGNSRERIELGADFLAGFVFRNFVSGATRADFQTSVALVGDYDDAAGPGHGTPEERVAAFRTGYYYRGAPGDVNAANRYFQRDGFGSIKAVSAP